MTGSSSHGKYMEVSMPFQGENGFHGGSPGIFPWCKFMCSEESSRICRLVQYVNACRVCHVRHSSTWNCTTVQQHHANLMSSYPKCPPAWEIISVKVVDFLSQVCITWHRETHQNQNISIISIYANTIYYIKIIYYFNRSAIILKFQPFELIWTPSLSCVYWTMHMQAHEITKFLTSQRKSGAPGFSWWFATITACLPLDSRICFLGSTNWGSWMEPIPSSHEVHVTVDLRSQSMFREPCDAIWIYLL